MLVNDPEAAHWEVDPSRTDLVEEFRRNPKGPHSDDLRRLLHRMRWSGVGGRYVLIVLEPGKRWMLGKLPGKRGAPIETMHNRIYDSVAKAEWDIFKIRWQALTGSSVEGE